MREQLPAEIGNLLVVYNPLPEKAEMVRAYLHRLRETYGTVMTEIATDPDPAVTQRKVQDNLQPGIANRVAVIGGDGTGGAAATGLADPEVVDRFGCVGMAFLPTEGANDMFNVFAQPGTDPVRTINKTWALGIRPVRAVVTQPEAAPAIERAAAYLSIGATATGATYLNSPTSRKRQAQESPVIHDIRTVLYTLLHAKRFQLTDNVTGETRILWDKIFPAIPLMAKKARFPHVGAEDTELHMYTAGGRQPVATAMIGLLLHLMEHTIATAGNTVSYTLGDRPKKGIWLQRDGEAIHIAVGSTVTISRETTPYYYIFP